MYKRSERKTCPGVGDQQMKFPWILDFDVNLETSCNWRTLIREGQKGQLDHEAGLGGKLLLGKNIVHSFRLRHSQEN